MKCSVREHDSWLKLHDMWLFWQGTELDWTKIVGLPDHLLRTTMEFWVAQFICFLNIEYESQFRMRIVCLVQVDWLLQSYLCLYWKHFLWKKWLFEGSLIWRRGKQCETVVDENKVWSTVSSHDNGRETICDTGRGVSKFLQQKLSANLYFLKAHFRDWTVGIVSPWDAIPKTLLQNFELQKL